jgi:hypothetical protein
MTIDGNRQDEVFNPELDFRALSIAGQLHVQGCFFYMGILNPDSFSAIVSSSMFIVTLDETLRPPVLGRTLK